MIDTLVVLLVGFSVVSLAILLAAYLWFFTAVPRTALGTAACVVLCLGLAALQLAHLHHVRSGADLLDARPYVALLFIVPPAFYFFSRDVLVPGAGPAARDALHAAPLLLLALSPVRPLVLVAFAVGAGYSVWLARVVYGMRRNVGRFRFEMFFFGLFAAIAVLVLVLAASMPWLGASAFHLSYAAAIALSVALVTAALLAFPGILTDIREAAILSYANSTLKGIDVEAKVAALDQLMTVDRLYRNDNLGLALLAEGVGLSTHQLSELINTRFGVGFSRFVRERRVEEAKQLLRQDQRSSALSIGVACGFGSQSNFYAAFKEVTGESPAAFRKRHSGGTPAPE